jgi:hypothetical protein
MPEHHHVSLSGAQTTINLLSWCTNPKNSGIAQKPHPQWVVPEKIHTRPPRRKFSLSEGGGRKNVLGCPKGGRGKMS